MTLTGPPGIGKSRLALEVAALPPEPYADAAVVVDLVPLADPARFDEAVAHELALQETTGVPLAEQLVARLRERPVLLVLDNFEHLLGAAGRVAALLQACPELRVVATSRLPLHLDWEHEFPVPPLAVPDSSAPPVPDVVGRYDAVALFLTRARQAVPEFGLTAHNAAEVAELCRRLDGLPLALELAAPWLKVLTPGAMLDRLAHRLEFLRRIGRELPPRHQTLRGAIGWSYALLGPPEQALLRRLAVFVGGFTLDAAEAVCWSASQPVAAIDALSRLVDASLVARDPRTDEPRFRLLETVRAFAAEQLAASGEEPAVHRHHAAYFLATAEHAETRMHGPEQGEWVRRLEDEHDNLRAALGWTIEHDEAQAALRLAAALWWFWFVRGHLSEGRLWLQTALDAARDAPPPLRVAAAYGLGVLAWRQSDFDEAARRGQETLALYRRVDDRWGMARALFLLEMTVRSRGDHARGTALLEESLALFHQSGDAWGVATTLLNLGTATHQGGDPKRAATYQQESVRLFREQGDFSGVAASLYALGLALRDQGDPRARTVAEEALTAARSLGDPLRVAFALNLVGLVARDRGEYDHAGTAHRESLELFTSLGDTWGVAYTLGNLATLALQQGDDDRARTLFLDSLRRRAEHGDRWGIAECLEGLALAGPGRTGAGTAARLLGAAEALRQAMGTELPASVRARHARAGSAARTALGKRRYEDARARGRTEPLGGLIADLLLADARRPTPSGAMPPDAGADAPAAGAGARSAGAPGDASAPAEGIGPGTGPGQAQVRLPAKGDPGRTRLTRREVEVARLIAQGLTNREIAARLYVTEGTVATHVQHVLNRLGFHSRAQVAAWASRYLS